MEAQVGSSSWKLKAEVFCVEELQMRYSGQHRNMLSRLGPLALALVCFCGLIGCRNSPTGTEASGSSIASFPVSSPVLTPDSRVGADTLEGSELAEASFIEGEAGSGEIGSGEIGSVVDESDEVGFVEASGEVGFGDELILADEEFTSGVVPEPVVLAPVVPAPVVPAPVVPAPVVPATVVPATVLQVPDTTLPEDYWTIPMRTTVPYAAAPSAKLAVSNTIEWFGAQVPVYVGWVAYSTPDAVWGSAGLNTRLKTEFSTAMATDPSRIYMVREVEQSQPNPAVMVVIVRPNAGIDAKEATSRIVASAQQIEQMSRVSGGTVSWLGTNAVVTTLSGPGGKTRLLQVTNLRDGRLVVVQATGADLDLLGVHAQLASQLTIGPYSP